VVCARVTVTTRLLPIIVVWFRFVVQIDVEAQGFPNPDSWRACRTFMLFAVFGTAIPWMYLCRDFGESAPEQAKPLYAIRVIAIAGALPYLKDPTFGRRLGDMSSHHRASLCVARPGSLNWLTAVIYSSSIYEANGAAM
jgi:hypothetical protein